MHKLILASLLCAVAACADMPTQQTTGCIRGDPGGSLACQAATYRYAR